MLMCVEYALAFLSTALFSAAIVNEENASLFHENATSLFQSHKFASSLPRLHLPDCIQLHIRPRIPHFSPTENTNTAVDHESPARSPERASIKP